MTHVLWNGIDSQLEERDSLILRDARKRNCSFFTEEDVINFVHFPSENSIGESPAKLLTFLDKTNHRKEKPIIKAKTDFDKLLVLAEQNEILSHQQTTPSPGFFPLPSFVIISSIRPTL